MTTLKYTKNMREIFDAVVGITGAKSPMYKKGANTDQELLEEIDGQAEFYYKAIDNEQAQVVLKLIRRWENEGKAPHFLEMYLDRQGARPYTNFSTYADRS